MATEQPTTAAPLPVSPPPLVIPHVLTPEELAGLLRVGEALADIQARLAAMTGRPGGPLAGELRDLAAVTLDLLDAVDGDPDLEPSTGYVAPGQVDEGEEGGDAEPSLGWSATGATAPLDGTVWLADLEEEHDGREPDADNEPDADGEPWGVPVRLDVALAGEEAAHG